MMLLVSFWRSDRSGGIAPGDCVVAAPRFPVDKADIEAVREALMRIVEPGMAPAARVTLVNIVRLG
jgi:hypothetical protein